MIKTPSTVLLHTCCAPCATHCIETLKEITSVTLFFSNAQISPHAEYCRRRDAVRMLADRYGIPWIEDVYDHAAWCAHVQGTEDAPEGGARCRKCFAYTLGRTAVYANAAGFGGFSTTLTVSPHKASAVIFSVGAAHALFLPYDFKKNDGFAQSVRLSAEYGLYRQTYCGCEFSAPPCAPQAASRKPRAVREAQE